MPNKRKSMKQIRKIIEMSLSDRSFSIREISRATGISRPTVSEYLQKIQDKFKTPAEIEGLNDTELKEALDIQNPVLLNTEENGKLIDWLTQNISRLNPHFSPIDFFLGLRQFGGLLEMLEASNRVY
jgi:predicted XRE-type DNA-binding protein